MHLGLFVAVNTVNFVNIVTLILYNTWNKRVKGIVALFISLFLLKSRCYYFFQMLAEMQ
jgi:hypothetical protein